MHVKLFSHAENEDDSKVSSSKNTPTKTKSLVEFSAAKTGALAVTDRFHTEEGRLVHDSCTTDIDFMVQYEDFWFAIHLDQQGSKSYLRVHGIIGRLPYSYESVFARANILTVVHAASRALGASLVKIDEKQRILLIDTVSVEGIMTPKRVLAETAKILLKVKPYLELVKQLQPPKRPTTAEPQTA